MRLLWVAAVLCVSAFGALSLAAGASSRSGDSATPVGTLPGLSTPVNFDQYSGYVTVGGGRQLFYWFVASQRSRSSDPLVLWLTGGPGCSGLLAFLTEHGPFTAQMDGKTLLANPSSWNTVANVIYVEAPCGVGFSYSPDGNYTTGDDQTAEDNFLFVHGFLKLFPEFADRAFFVSGESYAGHYVPQLTLRILKGNDADPITAINLQGMLVGNPSFDFSVDANVYLPFMANHGLLSESQITLARNVCHDQFYPSPSAECTNLQNELNANFGYINPYNVEDYCVGGGPDPSGGCFTANLLTSVRRKKLGAVREHELMGSGASNSVTLGGSFGQTFVPCVDVAHVVNYVNQQAVRDALHVSEQAMLPWDVCSPHVNYTQYAPSMYPVYQAILQYPQVRILVYSGDQDSCVPYLGTARCVAGLGLGLISEWQPWNVTDPTGHLQYAGYITRYESNVSYLTIKGAGHMVPTFKPREALQFFTHFLAGDL